jgi:hypothetical protein
MSVAKIRRPGTQAEAWEFTCDADPGCPDSGYLSAHDLGSLDYVVRVLRAYGWEVLVKDPVLIEVEAYCPGHTKNPPPPPTLRFYMGQPYGPGTEELRERMGMS